MDVFFTNPDALKIEAMDVDIKDIVARFNFSKVWEQVRQEMRVLTGWSGRKQLIGISDLSLTSPMSFPSQA